MTVEAQIEGYIAGLPDKNRDDMRALHSRVQQLSPASRLWFLDGRNEAGKAVTNPNIGYGVLPHRYAGGETRDFYRVGLSANTGGISVYIMGIEDKAYLAQAYGERLGKASVTGYCIRFKALKDIDIDVLEEAIRSRLQ